MKKRLIRHYFNMVEIALALAVLAIGMSSILVLFPVGINANKSAIADNNLADIGEYLMGYLRAGCAAEWAKIAKDRKDAEKTGAASPPNSKDFSFSNAIATDYESVKNLGEPKDGDNYKGIDLRVYDENDSHYDRNRRLTDSLYLLQDRAAPYANSTFLYQQKTGDIVDFAAVVKVWREKYSFYTLDPKENLKKCGEITVDPSTYNKESVALYATALCIEISWPAQAPYDQRETRLFRQEIFNEAYRYYD